MLYRGKSITFGTVISLYTEQMWSGVEEVFLVVLGWRLVIGFTLVSGCIRWALEASPAYRMLMGSGLPRGQGPTQHPHHVTKSLIKKVDL